MIYNKSWNFEPEFRVQKVSKKSQYIKFLCNVNIKMNYSKYKPIKIDY